MLYGLKKIDRPSRFIRLGAGMVFTGAFGAGLEKFLTIHIGHPFFLVIGIPAALCQIAGVLVFVVGAVLLIARCGNRPFGDA